MKRISIIILVIFNVLYLSAQQNLRAYYKNVALAENCIIVEDYAKAAKYYRKAQKSKYFMFERDLKNALFSEIMSNKPSKVQTLSYTKQLNQLTGYSMKESYKEYIANIDTTLFYTNKIKVFSDENIDTIIKQMLDLDQKYRQNINYDDSIQLLNIRISDTLNMNRAKEILDTFNLFDITKISQNSDSSIGSMLIHWLDYDENRQYFLNKLKESVWAGTFDANRYAYFADISKLRKSGIDSVSNYGTYYFSVFIEPDANHEYSKIYVFSFYDIENEKYKSELIKTDKLRETIFLDKTIPNFIRTIKLFDFTRQHSVGSWLLGSCTDSFFFLDAKEDVIKNELNKMLKKNPNLNYYITGEHDFNTK
jgi:hypothetical protein